MSCHKCKKRKKFCSCEEDFMEVAPASPCDSLDCPDPEPCPEVIPLNCIAPLSGDKLCGSDVVYAQGVTVEQALSSTVDYFCTALSSMSFVQSVTGDGVDNTDPLNPVIDLSAYAFTADLAPVAFSGDYNDLLNTPTVENFANADLLLTGPRIHNFDDNSMYFQKVGLLQIEGETRIKAKSNNFADVSYGLRNFNDTTWLHRVTGDGKWGIGMNPFSNARVSINESSVWGLYINASGDTAIVAESANRAIMGDSSGSYGADFGSTANFALNLRGYSGMRYTLNGIASRRGISIVDGLSTEIFAITGDGILQMDGMQIGNAGRTSGQVYKDTAANILANGDYILAIKA